MYLNYNIHFFIDLKKGGIKVDEDIIDVSFKPMLP